MLRRFMHPAYIILLLLLGLGIALNAGLFNPISVSDSAPISKSESQKTSHKAKAEQAKKQVVTSGENTSQSTLQKPEDKASARHPLAKTAKKTVAQKASKKVSAKKPATKIKKLAVKTASKNNADTGLKSGTNKHHAKAKNPQNADAQPITKPAEKAAPFVQITIAGEAFTVETARNFASRRRGLMFRQNIPKCGGMLFFFDKTEKVSFWMKNTPTPLWIGFIGTNNRITHIHRRAQPFDLSQIPSYSAVNKVLEIRADCPRLSEIGLGAQVIMHAKSAS
jgi:uncharacterized membrane protein (UPF0127 family)